MTPSPIRPHEVAVVVFDGFQSLDVTGPIEVLHTASLVLGATPGYRIRVTGPGATATSSSSLRLATDTTLAADTDPIDTLVVAGGLGVDRAAADPTFVAGVARLIDRADRITSVCTGAFALAATGHLDGKRAATHWASCDQLAASHPAITVESDAIFVRDDRTWTSAGVTAGMDLALALVTEDHGSELAHTVAGWLVMFTQRAGGQSQFSAHLTPMARTEPLRDLQHWIVDHLGDDLSVARLAARCTMSPRHFARQFRLEIGTTPAAYVEALRIDAARKLLETTDLTIGQVASRVGFRSDAVLHRSFARAVRTTPGTYRNHFGRAAATATTTTTTTRS